MTLSPHSRLSNIAFGLWLVGGVVLVIANWWLADYWWTNYSSHWSVIIVGREAEHEICHRLKMVLDVFFFGSLVYGPLGAVLFRRHEGGVCGCLAGGFLVFVLVCVGQCQGV